MPIEEVKTESIANSFKKCRSEVAQGQSERKGCCGIKAGHGFFFSVIKMRKTGTCFNTAVDPERERLNNKREGTIMRVP